MSDSFLQTRAAERQREGLGEINGERDRYVEGRERK